MKKIIATENGKVTVRGNSAWIPIEYKQADWSDGEEVPCFKYDGEYVFLDDFVVTDPRGIFNEYDGILGFTYECGLLIKIKSSPFGDAVQVYYFHY